MTVSELLFEISGSTRFDILQALNSTPFGFTKISEQVDITTSEASRQIARLIKADLIEKSSDSMYHITPFGRLLLSFIPGIDYIYNNRDYFLLHDTAPLPNEGDYNEHTNKTNAAMGFGCYVRGTYGSLLYSNQIANSLPW